MCWTLAYPRVYAHAINFKQDAEISTTYSRQWVRVLTEVFTCTYWSEYLVLILVSARTYQSVYVHLLKWVPRTYSREYAYLPKCLRALTEVNTSYLFSWIRALVVVVLSSKSPNGAILFHSPGRKPWVRHWYPFFWAPLGAALLRPHPHNDTNQTCALLVPLLKELNPLLSACTQGFISGFALIPPWAMQECRPYRAYLGKC